MQIYKTTPYEVYPYLLSLLDTRNATLKYLEYRNECIKKEMERKVFMSVSDNDDDDTTMTNRDRCTTPWQTS